MFQGRRTATTSPGAAAVKGLALLVAPIWLLASPAVASPSRVARAARTEQPPVLDGLLDEPVWLAVPVAEGFRQTTPIEEGTPTGDTRVRFLYDDRHLYIGVECHDPLGEAGLRVQDLRRDFDRDQTDHFGVVFDTLRDGHLGTGFFVTPFGAVRDEQRLDDVLRNLEWDTIWRAETRRHASGWTAEIAIPWRSLRYPAKATTFGLHLIRTLRRLNEWTTWSPYPRRYSPFRLEYAGVLEGLEPPPAGALDVVVRPSAATRVEAPAGTERELSFHPSLDLRWTPTATATLDLTVNTDFAEADVDAIVVNLARLSLFLPERRPFFLENASLFQLGRPQFLAPFFSRRIGLAEGVAVPIDAGGRFVWRDPAQSAAALVVHTRETETQPSTLFAVARYTRNLGTAARLGAMTVLARDGADEARWNVVPALDGFFRRDWFTLSASMMTSHTTGASAGAAADLQLGANTSHLDATFAATLVSRGFDARAGFVARADTLRTTPRIQLELRPESGGWWRFYRAITELDVSTALSTGELQEAMLYLEPAWLQLESSDDLWINGTLNWQVPDEPFEPVPGVRFEPGEHRYARTSINFQSDQSRKLYTWLRAEAGGFYSAQLFELYSELALRPWPFVAVAGTYTLSHFYGLGEGAAPITSHLIRPELRLAASPRLQLVGSYQRETASRRVVWNARLSWEWNPLSFVYVVFNRTRAETVDNQLVVKASWSWQP